MNKFNPQEWLSDEENSGKPTGTEAALKASTAASGGIRTRTYAENRDRVEHALDALEASGTDLTSSYKSWLEIGFAFVDAFQESGREYFHRVSQFHPEYDRRECDRQYDHCLKSTGSGVSLATFFHLLKESSQEMFRYAVPPATPPPLPEAEESFWDSHQAPGSFEDPMPEGILEGRPTSQDRAAGSGKNRFPVSGSRELEETDTSVLPALPSEIFPKLPRLLQQVIAPAGEQAERDVLLLGAITTLSAGLPMVYGKYYKTRVGPNLYFFVTAPASAGKGRLNLCRRLVLPLHRKMREESKLLKQEYELALAAYNAGQTSEKPLKPSEQMLVIPANNSATGFNELLGANKGRGLLFETEADTMTETLKTDYGNYSHSLRQAFHHETIAYYRRTDKEHVEIEEPRLSVVLSGTPRQVNRLVPSAENGLFSRFLFYYMNLTNVWMDVFAEDDDYGAEEHFNNLGAEFMSFHQRLEQHGDLRIRLSTEQAGKFNALFSQIQTEFTALEGEDSTAIVRRMGLICFRIAMVLTSLRLMDQEEFPQSLYCSEDDFETAVAIVHCLFEHSRFVYNCLPESPGVQVRTSRNRKFLDALPKQFTRRDYLQVAARLRIPPKTAEKYVYKFVEARKLQRQSQGVYLRKGLQHV